MSEPTKLVVITLGLSGLFAIVLILNAMIAA